MIVMSDDYIVQLEYSKGVAKIIDSIEINGKDFSGIWIDDKSGNRVYTKSISDLFNAINLITPRFGVCAYDSVDNLRSSIQTYHGAMKDLWKHRSCGMKCRTCMWCVLKEPILNAAQLAGTNKKNVGRCRRHAPTMNGYPVIFEDDWCGDHKLDETKV